MPKTRFVGCWQGGDCEGGEEAVGEGWEAGEEDGGIIWSAAISRHA